MPGHRLAGDLIDDQQVMRRRRILVNPLLPVRRAFDDASARIAPVPSPHKANTQGAPCESTRFPSDARPHAGCGNRSCSDEASPTGKPPAPEPADAGPAAADSHPTGSGRRRQYPKPAPIDASDGPRPRIPIMRIMHIMLKHERAWRGRPVWLVETPGSFFPTAVERRLLPRIERSLSLASTVASQPLRFLAWQMTRRDIHPPLLSACSSSPHRPLCSCAASCSRAS